MVRVSKRGFLSRASARSAGAPSPPTSAHVHAVFCETHSGFELASDTWLGLPLRTPARETLEKLFPRRQLGHRRRSDAEELQASETTGRQIAGVAAVNGCCKAADLSGVHRRIGGFRSTWRVVCTSCPFSPVVEEFQPF